MNFVPVNLTRLAIFALLASCVTAFSAREVRADLKEKQARKSITRMAGFELTSGSVRIKSIAQTSATTAEVAADIRSVFKFEKDKTGTWRVAEIRTGQDRWEEINLIAKAMGAQPVVNNCTAPEPPFKGAAAIDPSMKRTRCLLGNLLRIRVPSDALRIQQVDPLVIPIATQPSAVVVAWVKANLRLVNGGNGWVVTEIRTGDSDWVNVQSTVAALQEAKRDKARAELQTIAEALELFRRARGYYVLSDKEAVAVDYLSPKYLAQIIRLDPWHEPYLYEGERDRFTLRSKGADRKENTPDDIVFGRSP